MVHGGAGIVPLGNDAAVGRSDADGVNFKPALRGIFGGGEDASFEVLAIGDEDEEFHVVGLAAEGVDGLVDGAGDVAARTRNGVGVEFAHGGLEGVVVERQGALQKGVAGKGDQAEPVVGKVIGEIGYGQLGAFDAVRFHVLGQHALGAIDGEENVEAAAVFFLPVEQKMGPRQGREEKARGGGEKNRLQQPLEG